MPTFKALIEVELEYEIEAASSEAAWDELEQAVNDLESEPSPIPHAKVVVITWNVVE